MIGIYRLFFVFLFFSVNANLWSQSHSFFDSNSNTFDRQGISFIPINNDMFVLHSLVGGPKKSDFESTFYYDYTDMLYKMDSDLNVLDSVSFPPFQGYGLRLYGGINISDSVISVSGLAYDSLSGDYQVYMAWLNDDFEILNEYIWGNNEVPEGLYPPRQNKAGNLVQLGWYPFNPATGMHQHFYLEYLPSGELLRFVEDSSSVQRFDIVSFGNVGKYTQFSSESLTILNPDFSTDTVIAIPSNADFWLRRFGLLNDSTFYVGGDIKVPSQVYDSDPAIIPIGIDGQIFPVIHAGAVDTIDFFAEFKLMSDGYLLSGSKNAYPGLPSFFMVNKLDLDFQKVYSTSYGDGVRTYILYDIIAMHDGGCIATGRAENYDPNFLYNTRNDLILVRFDGNGVLVGQPKVIEDHQSLMLAPNPATGLVAIVGQKTCWVSAEIFDIEGRVVSRLKVESCSFFDVQHLSTGLFLVRLTTESGLNGFVRMVKL